MTATQTASVDVENQVTLPTETLEESVVSNSPEQRVFQEAEAMRADLDSFRALANFSARSAVAKSNQLREQVILKSLGAITGFGWLITLALFSVDLWSTSNYRSLATVVGSCTLISTAKMFFSYLSIKEWEVSDQIISEAKKTDLRDEKEAT